MNNERLLRRADIKSIRDGNKTPKDAGFGKMLNVMKSCFL